MQHGNCGSIVAVAQGWLRRQVPSQRHWPGKALQASRKLRGSRLQLQRRCAASLPQIPGVILTNKEIPEDRLVGRIRRWVQSSEILSDGSFDLLQLAEQVDGKLAPRAICGLLRARLSLADDDAPVRALVVIFYRARDFLNREFWDTQVKRLCDVVAEEYLAGDRGVQLMVHHNPPVFPLGLEIGDHRLLAEASALHIFGSSSHSSASSVGSSAVLVDDGLPDAASGHSGFHRLCTMSAGSEQSVAEQLSSSIGTARRGRYVLRTADGAAVCGLSVLGAQPFRLVCGSPWAAKGYELDFGTLVNQVRRLSGKSMCTIVADRRDPHWKRLCGSPEATHRLGLWRRQRPLGVAVTGAPIGLKPQEQAKLATAPFLIPWEFLPFHSGRVMLI